ncbi:hypothetical protein HPB47_016942 [Ixodes persulcatus]|uniref:Uncharacterized protein n=1 Tax=Ixodes persulcatus TaxID=34615 RepID=A0AC60QT63_IXOPE|nr:hypothetical protein HPB47_016942 [Ixodes persulcatus]
MAIDNAVPPAFKDRYPSTRVNLDATEIKCETSSSLELQSPTFSQYKSTNTFKGLIGISPDGTVTFVSELFTGSISDKEGVLRSGFPKLSFDDGDLVMVDKLRVEGRRLAPKDQREAQHTSVPSEGAFHG